MIRTHENNRAALVAALALACLAGAIISAPAGAAPMADLRGGVYPDQGVAVGGGVIGQLGGSPTWYFNPNVEAAFASEKDVVSVNGDIHYDFRSTSPYNFYAGGGPALIIVNRDRGDDRTDGGLNLVGGVNWHNPSLRPFVQMKGVVTNQSQVALMGGIRF